MGYVRNALLAGLTVGVVAVALLFLSGGAPTPSSSPTPSASVGDFTPLRPNLVPAAEFVNGRSIGRSDAPVTLEVWTDYQCPYCGAWANGIEPTLYERYITEGKLRIVHHDFAFLGDGSAADESMNAAAGATCAERQDPAKFWAFHSYLFANQNGENQGWFSVERLRTIAAAIGLDTAAWESCMADPTVRARISADTDAARQLGVTSTPTLKIGDWMNPGVPTIDDISSRIDAALAP